MRLLCDCNVTGELQNKMLIKIRIKPCKNGFTVFTERGYWNMFVSKSIAKNNQEILDVIAEVLETKLIDCDKEKLTPG
jgi:hypothetical protein